jgi:uncharacterized membrane protein
MENTRLGNLVLMADLADKMIAAAEEQGKDTNDPKVMQELGREINALGTPVSRNESVMTAVFVSLWIMIDFGIAIGIWGLVFKKAFLVFGLYGILVGLLISLFFTPVIAFQRTKESIRNMTAGFNNMFHNLAIIVGVVGLIAWGVRAIFFH